MLQAVRSLKGKDLPFNISSSIWPARINTSPLTAYSAFFIWEPIESRVRTFWENFRASIIICVGFRLVD
jgi:hypothetical protein